MSGVLGACSTLFPRVAIASAAIDPPTAIALMWRFAAPFLIGLGLTYASAGNGVRTGAAPHTDVNPLQVGPALQMAAFFQLVLFGVHAADRFWGETGLLMSGAILGLTDVDALTISMANLGSAQSMPVLAAQAITIGVLTNTLLKAGIALAVGRGAFRWRTTAGLLLLAASLALGLVVLPG